MTIPTVQNQQVAVGQLNTSDGHRFALVSLTSLFFMWGFITAMNDILIPHLKGVFSLNYTQAMLIQFCFFGAYFIVSVPAGRLVKKIGFQKGISTGLTIASIGCLLFIPAATNEIYWVFLAALFVLASGITILQVAANPLVTLLGKPETASSRLTLTQAFNSLGTTIAPIIGGILIFSAVAGESQASADTVILPYVALAAVLFFLAIIFLKLALPDMDMAHQSTASSSTNNQVVQSPLQHRHLVLGAIGIFVYVGGEVSIGSFLVNFFGEAHIAGLAESEAAGYIAYYWGGAMVGRFIGAALMQRVSATRLLAFNSMASITLIAIAMTTSGSLAMWSILLVGFFNSIMFPTIFSLALAGLGQQTSKGSGILCLAIVGGALVPLMQGVLADTIGLQLSFILPLICYLYIAYYGLWGSKPRAWK
ncbi:MAG: FHS family L-fucose permease-like MFS transporter [Paraglaciecola sp.]|jgi:FHS family L-fucose permease-like MFS transporter